MKNTSKTKKSNVTPVTLINSKSIKNILTEKKRIETTLLNDWKRLYNNNQILNSQKRDFDIDALYSMIIKGEEALYNLKLAQIAANVGLTKISELPEKSNYRNIYKLSNLELRKQNLEKILKERSRNEEIKNAKHPIVFKSHFDEIKLLELISTTQAEIDIIKTNIEAFNDNSFILNDLPF